MDDGSGDEKNEPRSQRREWLGGGEGQAGELFSGTKRLASRVSASKKRLHDKKGMTSPIIARRASSFIYCVQETKTSKTSGVTRRDLQRCPRE